MFYNLVIEYLYAAGHVVPITLDTNMVAPLKTNRTE